MCVCVCVCVCVQGERACMAIGLAKSSFNNMRHPGWCVCVCVCVCMFCVCVVCVCMCVRTCVWCACACIHIYIHLQKRVQMHSSAPKNRLTRVPRRRRTLIFFKPYFFRAPESYGDHADDGRRFPRTLIFFNTLFFREPGSYGYHADDGRKFHNSSRGEAYRFVFVVQFIFLVTKA